MEINRQISKNNVPLASSNPFCFPAIENAWQGNPAQRISKFGISKIDSLVIIVRSQKQEML